jgi:hypothetical protein
MCDMPDIAITTLYGNPELSESEKLDVESTAQRRALQEMAAREAIGAAEQTGIYGPYQPERGFMAGCFIVGIGLFIVCCTGVYITWRRHHGH